MFVLEDEGNAALSPLILVSGKEKHFPHLRARTFSTQNFQQLNCQQKILERHSRHPIRKKPTIEGMSQNLLGKNGQHFPLISTQNFQTSTRRTKILG